MPLCETAVGHELEPLIVRPDARWCMAYAAGVPDDRPELYATDANLLVHPLFPVAPEWGLITTSRALPEGMTHDEARRGIHVGHELVLHRPLIAGEAITMHARITAVGRRSAGAVQEMLFTATAKNGEVVWRTKLSSLFLGVALEGEPTATELDWPALPDRPMDGEPIATRQSSVRAVDAHVYSECARIWNPIHTDIVAARAAGLAAPILHGTATLARAVSIVTDLAGVPLGDVRRVAAQFGAMVALGSTIDVRLLGHDRATITFDVLEQGGHKALSNGLIRLTE